MSSKTDPCFEPDPAPSNDVEEGPPPVPGHRNFLIGVDESGTGGAVHYGFGTFWVPYEGRGRLSRVLKTLRARHDYQGEIKWTKISRVNEPFYRDLLVAFFEHDWMMFHALIVRKGYVDRDLHNGDYDLARRKHLTMLISTKVGYFNDGASDKRYHVHIDPIASRYAKADEVAHLIANREIEHAQGVSPIASFLTRDSKQSNAIQMCDFLLGAAMAEWQGDVKADHKKRIVSLLAWHLGWPDMMADTLPSEAKFNLWSFHNPAAGLPRDRQTRGVRLRFPMRVFQPRGARAATAAG